MGTLSKTLAGCGGYIAGSATLVDYLRCLAGAFVYSVGMPPVIAASVRKGAGDHAPRAGARRDAAAATASYFYETAKRLKASTPATAPARRVCPIVVGDSIPAVILSQQLSQARHQRAAGALSGRAGEVVAPALLPHRHA